MTRHDQPEFSFAHLKLTALVAACVGLGACSVADPLAVRSVLGAPAPAMTEIAMAVPDGGGDSPVSQMAQALRGSFESRDMAITSNGELIADYALAITPATIGVQNAPPTSPDQETVWISPPRPAGRWDICDAMELRGTLVLMNRETSEVAYRGQARIIDCDFDAAAIAALADGLVADFATKSGR